MRLADKLLKVGTLRQNKREIPKEMLHSKNRKVGSSLFCFDKENHLFLIRLKRIKV